MAISETKPQGNELLSRVRANINEAKMAEKSREPEMAVTSPRYAGQVDQSAGRSL